MVRALTMGSNHVTMVLDQLQSRGLIERRPHPHDRRQLNVLAGNLRRVLAGVVVPDARARPGP